MLKAAMELMQEDDLRRASIDRISARSGVSKATIYKWWPNRTAVAIDAFLHQMMADAPVPDTGSAAEDFRLAQFPDVVVRSTQPIVLELISR